MNDTVVTEKLVKRQKDCNFITIGDRSLFKDVKLPSSPTNYVLWYKKETPNDWGLTIKRFDDTETFNSQYTWKLTWIYKDLEDVLIPSNASAEFTDTIRGEVCAKLCEIKNKHVNKSKK